MSTNERHRTIGEVSDLLGVSVRTIRYWESRGLVSPARREFSAYRLYSDADITRLQQTLVYRATGMSLEAIGEVLNSHDDTLTHLKRQRAVLIRKRNELDRMIRALDQLTEDAMGRKQLSVKDVAQILDEADFPAWQAEAEEKWGGTDEWHDAANTQASMSPQEWNEYKVQASDLESRLAAALKAGVEAGSEEANALAEEHRALLSRFFPVTHAKHVLIARNYVSDPRFAKHYDGTAAGLAGWLKDVIDACAAANGVDPENAQWA